MSPKRRLKQRRLTPRPEKNAEDAARILSSLVRSLHGIRKRAEAIHIELLKKRLQS